MDSPSSSGYDIKSLASQDANTFVGNTCLTSLNAPCPSVGPTLTANPNPIPVTGNAIVGMTTLSWNAPAAQLVEIHIGSPDGTLFAQMGSRGSAQTGVWVSDGLTFYLQDVTNGQSLTSDHTLATLVVHLQRSGAAQIHFRGGPQSWAGGAAILLGFGLCCVLLQRSRPRMKRLRVVLGGAALLALVVFAMSQTTAAASSPPSAQQTAATLDRMVAAHKSQLELAQYVFDTHGCRNCHTVGQNGKLGFTAKGQQVAQGYEGCISLLTAMSRIARLPDSQRSTVQRDKAARFEEFGCALCHKTASGKMGLTDVGMKLTQLHLGCVDVEKLVASRPVTRN